MHIFNNRYGWALLAGSSCVFGFAPVGMFLVPVVALAVLFVLWQRGGTPRVAAGLGFAFGVGFFCAGVSWIYVALHEYGEMDAVLAFLATLLFASFLALFPALAGYVQARCRCPNMSRSILLMPVVWVFVEWVRGMIFTGFPWLAMGYAHTDSPLAGYAPVLGVYGVSFASAASSAAVAWLWCACCPGAGKESSFPCETRVGRTVDARQKAFVICALILLWAGGDLLRGHSWTKAFGKSFSVGLVQGNIPQELKFNESALYGTMETYRRLILKTDASLILLPETALPVLRRQLPATYVDELSEHARKNGGDVLFGVFEASNGSYYNSVFTEGADKEQRYRKRHLVPFGEFIPLRPLFGWFINGVLNIPMEDLTSGDERQQLLDVAGQRVAVNICYEDAFGEEIIRSLPQATLLVNASNDAWYGNSYAASQHNQISQMRALETGRMMLRATNTGVTSIISVDGKVLQQLPQHQEGVLFGTVQGYHGETPYVRWGNVPVLLLVFLMFLLAGFASRR
jgi:apolipoprotein N-acyltransferase